MPEIRIYRGGGGWLELGGEVGTVVKDRYWREGGVRRGADGWVGRFEGSGGKEVIVQGGEGGGKGKGRAGEGGGG